MYFAKKALVGLFIFIILVTLNGCAAKPESIAPAYVSHVSYVDWECQQLAQEQSRLVSALYTACDAQRQARTNDTVGVILLGLPVSSLSGSNQASNIARLKGELDAVQKALNKKKCNTEIVDLQDVIKEEKCDDENTKDNNKPWIQSSYSPSSLM